MSDKQSDMKYKKTKENYVISEVTRIVKDWKYIHENKWLPLKLSLSKFQNMEKIIVVLNHNRLKILSDIEQNNRIMYTLLVSCNTRKLK